MTQVWARLNEDGTPAELRSGGAKPQGAGWVAAPAGRRLAEIAGLVHGPEGWAPQTEDQRAARHRAFADSAEDIAKAARDRVRDARRAAFAAEADPLFFKVQRGEATEESYLAKVAEIRARLPYPEET